MVEHVISCDPDVMGGTAVFAGTRVPVQTLLDYLEAGESIDDFLEGFPFLESAAGRQLPGAGNGPPCRRILVRVR
jgi:uncharacterized protein (DUF433 family)